MQHQELWFSAFPLTSKQPKTDPFYILYNRSQRRDYISGAPGFLVVSTSCLKCWVVELNLEVGFRNAVFGRLGWKDFLHFGWPVWRCWLCSSMVQKASTVRPLFWVVRMVRLSSGCRITCSKPLCVRVRDWSLKLRLYEAYRHLLVNFSVASCFWDPHAGRLPST